MTRTALAEFNPPHDLSFRKSISTHLVEWTQTLPWLVTAALLSELITPFFIWKRVLPGASRWLGDLLILAIIVHAVWRMLRQDKIPSLFLLIVAFSAMSSVVAWYEGQSWQATAWGIWLMFKYPMVGIYVYLHRKWLPDFPRRFVYMLLYLLIFETGFQLIQFALGEVPDDNLAGTFGKNGVAPLLMFIVLVICTGFAHWIVTNTWSLLGITILLGALSSALGEMKVYPIAVLAVACIGIGILIIRRGKISQALLSIVAFAVVMPIFVILYNTLVADARGTRRLEEYLNTDITEGYLQNRGLTDDGIYYFGRGFALEYAWNTIQRDTTTLLMGYGIGARADSKALGIVGQALIQSDYGRTSGGTSLLILLQELGVGGMMLIALFMLYYSLALYHDTNIDVDLYAQILRYGLLLFSVTWPLWLWYTRSWHYSVSMILYWSAVGYTLSHRPKPS